MHFAIRFLTRYEYDTRTSSTTSHNHPARRPPATAAKRVDDFTVRLTPDVRQYRHEDYFGTEVVEFEVVARPPRAGDRRARAREPPNRSANPPARPGRS